MTRMTGPDCAVIMHNLIHTHTHTHTTRGMRAPDKLRSRGPMSVHAYLSEGVTGSKGREGVNRVRGRIRVGSGNGDGNGVGGGNGQDVNGDGDGDGAGPRTGWRRTNERKMRTGTGAGTGQERDWRRGWRSVDEHGMGTGTGAGTETRAVAEMGTETRMGTGTGRRTGLGRADEMQRSARDRPRVVDAMWETGEIGVEREKNVDKKGLVQ